MELRVLLGGHCRTKEAAEKALAEMDGAQVGQWKIRCGWAHHKTEAVTGLDVDTVDRADPANTNVYVGNLPTEVHACSLLLRVIMPCHAKYTLASVPGSDISCLFSQHAAS